MCNACTLLACLVGNWVLIGSQISESAEESWKAEAKPKKMIVLEKVESEKQISVDPISLTESAPINKLMNCSLPSSGSSLAAFTKHRKKHKIHEGRLVMPLARQHSVALGNLERLRENHLRRSKSCGEGRACQPSIDFDLWSSQMELQTRARAKERRDDKEQEKFKCGACLFLPGLGKGKTVRARKEVEPQPQPQPQTYIEMVSQRVSLEKFECGSWRSSALMNYNEEDGATAASNLFFDLPVELIRCSSVNDAESPVTTGFVFDNNHRKGVLKACSKKSQELSNSSPRHVRFSTSSPKTSTSPSCITPRLHKARDDFNAFLQAQSA